jgi:hypothetical protein
LTSSVFCQSFELIPRWYFLALEALLVNLAGQAFEQLPSLKEVPSLCPAY